MTPLDLVQLGWCLVGIGLAVAAGSVAVSVATRAPSLPLDPSAEDARRAIRECWAQGCYADDVVSVRVDLQGRWWLLGTDHTEDPIGPDDVHAVLTSQYRWARALAELQAQAARGAR